MDVFHVYHCLSIIYMSNFWWKAYKQVTITHIFSGPKLKSYYNDLISSIREVSPNIKAMTINAQTVRNDEYVAIL